mgnify:CR=1 FL=1
MGVHSHLLVHHCGRGGVGRPRLLAMGQEYLHSSHFASLSFSFASIACLTNVMVLPVLWWIQGLGYVKAAITVIKYSPQVYINYKLQSTGAPHYHISYENPRSFG